MAAQIERYINRRPNDLGFELRLVDFRYVFGSHAACPGSSQQPRKWMRITLTRPANGLAAAARARGLNWTSPNTRTERFEAGTEAPLTYELESVTNEAPVPVVRLKVTAPRGAVNVSFGSGSGYSLAHYTVDKNGSQLRSAPWASPSVVEVKYIFATGCGSSNAFIVHVTPKADVYRIQAENKIWLVPDLSSDYSIYDGHGVLTVGHIACSEFSLPFNNPVGFDWTPQWSNGVEGLEYSPVCHVVPPPRRSGEVLGRGFECTSAVQFEFSGLVKRR